mmetsp:Transcript_4312/g.7341  ORF Transcript_4312/g.7341 Transcript_4312/m.7341 type:complete len:1416 (-) Transcript_4312:131-4378(-)
MTNYDGKSGYFHMKKKVVNREPLYVNKKIYQESIENLYKVHRYRVINSEPLVSTQKEVYDFLENQTWKKEAQKSKALRLLKTNELIYSRINKVETNDSQIMLQVKDHMRKISVGTHHMRRLKEIARQRGVDKIQRENIYQRERLAKIKPYYSKKLFDDAFKHHTTFVKGRRTDHTAGHIICCPKRLQSGPLPPVSPALRHGSSLPQPSASYHTMPTMDRESFPTGGDPQMMSSTSSLYSSTDSISLLEVPPKVRKAASNKPTKSPAEESVEINDDNRCMEEGDDEDYEDEDDFFSEDPRQIPSNVASGSKAALIAQNSFQSQHSMPPELLDTEGDDLAETHHLLASTPMNILPETKNCLLRVYARKEYSDTLVVRATTCLEPYKSLAVRDMHIDEVYDHIDSLTVKSVPQDDAQALRTMLMSMFQEADEDKNGYLTYEEYQSLMNLIEVGISPQELRFVIAEADDNENGYIDYQEFVPLAVDMIQAFRARLRAQKNMAAVESAINDEVLQMVSGEEVKRVTDAFFDEVKTYDTRNVGALRVNDMRICLKAVSLTCALSVNEKNLLFQSFPTDTFGRLIYKDFENALFEVKMATMRNMILESQGSDLHRVLMQMCRDEDRNILNQSSVYSGADSTASESSPALTGWLPMRALVNIMVGSPRLCLSRLQVMVITSEADVVDGKVNYHLFCPVAAKTIELMFEPKALKQRAELIETSDLSPETLLNGTSNEVFVERLENLFQSHDTDKVGELDAKQFRAMLEAMDLMLTPAEILSIMAIADNNGNGLISFDEFSKFCIKNLLHLEREKHIRVLQKSLHGTVISGDNGKVTDRASFVRMLKLLFSEADPEGCGLVSYRQLQDIFIKLDKKLSQYQILFLISECNANENGLVEYEKYIETCADFLEVIFTIKAEGDENNFDITFENKINEHENSWSNNVEYTVDNLQRELKLLSHISDKEAKNQMIVQIAQNRLNGLNQSESNILISMLLCDDEEEISDTDIVRMVRKIRLHSLVRGVMENMKSTTLAKHMLAALTEAAEECKRAKKEAEPPMLLPVRHIINALENDNEIPINRVQILTLLACTDAFHGVASGIDYREFAFGAADNIARMFSTDCMRLRSEISEQLKADGMYDLFGISEEEVLQHLETTLSQEDNLDGCVSCVLFVDALRSIPKLKLVDREAYAICGCAPCDENGLYDWRSFLPWAYGCITTVVRERLIARRLILRMPECSAENEMDSIIELQKMADRLSALLQVRKSGGTVSISLKSEVKPDHKRFSLLVPKGSPQKVSGSGAEENVASTNEASSKERGETPMESYEILRMVKLLPLRGKSNDPSIEQGLYVTLRVSENDPIISYDKPPLHITACTVDCKYNLDLPLYLRLPSLGLVDQDAARQFSKNLVEQLYVQVNTNSGKLELAID